MSGALLVEEPAEHVRRLTLDRPDRLNAITSELCQELHETVMSTFGQAPPEAIAAFLEKRTAEFAD